MAHFEIFGRRKRLGPEGIEALGKIWITGSLATAMAALEDMLES